MAKSSDVGKGNRLTGKPDEELVLAAVGGDLDSFLVLCQRYYPTMVAVTRAVLGDDHLCEDAVQEALAKACRKLDSLKSPSRFGAWLTAICRNEARSMLRQTPNAESLGDQDVPEKVCEEGPDVELVREAIRGLPVDARELLYLKYRNELSYEVIAELLDTTPQSVHGRLQRARQSVRAYVERQRNRRLS
jgi:RNA polymerase sigma-70 factor (ECF subfamily)